MIILYLKIKLKMFKIEIDIKEKYAKIPDN